jgi:hypothetical protein
VGQVLAKAIPLHVAEPDSAVMKSTFAEFRILTTTPESLRHCTIIER